MMSRRSAEARHGTRRERAQARREIERQEQLARQRRIVYGTGVALVVIAVAAGLIWWLTTREDDPIEPGSQALHTFDTADFHALAFNPPEADTIYFGHHDGVQLSRDGGRTWEPGIVRGIDVQQIAVPSATPERRYVAGPNAIMVSTDSGQTWRPQPNNLPALDLRAFAVAPSDANRLYVAPTGDSFWTSSDGGVVWTQVTKPPAWEGDRIAIAVAPADPLRVFATYGGLLAVSQDGGETWHPRPGPGRRTASIAASPEGDGTLYIGTDIGISRVTEGGSWERLPLVPDGPILAVAASLTNAGRIIAVDSAGNFYRSDDAGRSWIRGE
jgi:photosystem II stability/assembly factor-like uncharacterized protein